MSDVADEQMLYEIIELADGAIGLCQVGDERPSEPLVRITFSDEAKYFLDHSGSRLSLRVAKAMIEAGLDAVQTLQNEQAASASASIH